MASRVNVKFVLTLGISLVVLAGVVGYVGRQALKKSGAELAAMGDELMESGNPVEAARLYQRAVIRDQTRVDWLTKWRGALLQIVPETRVELQKFYNDFYRGILQRLAVLQPDSAEAQEEFLQTLLEEMRVSNAGPSEWQGLVDAATDAIERGPSDDPSFDRLYRYKGIAGLRRIAQIEESNAAREQVLEDLQRALEADPSDLETAIAVLQWRTMEWRRAIRMRRPETASSRWETVIEEIEAIRERFPESPRIEMHVLRARVDHTMAEHDSPFDRVEQIQALRAEGVADSFIEVLESADPAALDHRFVALTLPLLRVLRPDDWGELLLDLTERILDVRPDDARVRLIRGGVLRDMERFEDAIEEYETIAELPDRPVSIDALLLDEYQNRALVEQARAHLDIARQAETESARAEALEQAKAVRERLVERVPGGAGAPSVLLVDGELALLEDRPEAAVRHLTELDRVTAGTETEVIRLLGQALQATGTLGGAAEQFDRILSRNPFDIRALLAAAEVDRRLQDIDGAIEHLQMVLELVPENEQAIGILTALRAQRGELPEAAPDDPVIAALMRAEALRNRQPPDIEAAREVLEEAAAEHPDNNRLMTGRIQLEMQNGDPERAEALVEQAVERFPEDARFQRLARQFAARRSEAPVDAILDLIDESDATEADKFLRRFDVLTAAGRVEEADAALARAAELAPEANDVLERQFIRALEQDDLQEARALADRAAATNADQADGALYRARLDLIGGESESALSTLEGVVERLPYDALAWRLLGQTYLQVGRPDDALEALSRAYQYRPDDRRTARLYIRTLLALQRPSEALEAARQSTRRHPADAQIREYWLQLEERSGDKSVALNERLKRHASNPEDLDNAMALVGLLASEERYSEAADLLAQVRAQAPDNLNVVRLEAQVAASQGDVGRGESALRAFLDGVEEDELRARTLFALSDYLARHGDAEGANEALREAATLGGQAQTEAQWALAQRSRNAGDLEEALEIYAQVAEGDGPLAERARRGQAETLIVLDRFEEALALLEPEEDQEPTADILLLRARATAGAGDTQEAARLLNRAIELAPNDPRPFLRRAQLFAGDRDQFSDVIADLDQAIRLQPSLVIARQLKAALLTREGREGEAIAELRSLVELFPEWPEAHALLVRQLVELDRFTEAQTASDEAAKRFEEDPTWRRWAGDLYAETEAWDTATERYRAAYELAPEPIHAIRLGQAFLSKSSPEPEAALEAMAPHRNLDEPNPLMTITVARAHLAAGDLESAEPLVQSSLQRVDDPAELRSWWEQAGQMFKSPVAAAVFFERQTPPPSLEGVYEVLLAKKQVADPRRRSEVVARLQELRGEIEHEETLLDLHRLLGELLYASQQYTEAVDVYQRARELAPDDLEFNNNLAYLQAKHMGNPQAALEPAERAAELAPTDPNVLDTLGWVYYQIGRLGQARAALGKALNAATTDRQRLPTYLHLGQTALAEGDGAQARRHAQRAQELLRRLPGLADEYGTDLEELMRRLDQAE